MIVAGSLFVSHPLLRVVPIVMVALVSPGTTRGRVLRQARRRSATGLTHSVESPPAPSACAFVTGRYVPPGASQHE
jgi:hypothetical protein